MLGDLIKEAAEEYRNAPIGERIVSNSNLFVNTIVVLLYSFITFFILNNNIIIKNIIKNHF